MTVDAVSELNEELSPQRQVTAVTLANVAELSTAVISRVAGGDISTAINGSPVTKEMLGQLAFAEIQSTLKGASRAA